MKTLEIQKKHEAEVEKLNDIEKKLIDLIASTGEQEIMDTFSKWTEQRYKCNETYQNWIESLATTKYEKE